MNNIQSSPRPGYMGPAGGLTFGQSAAMSSQHTQMGGAQGQLPMPMGGQQQSFMVAMSQMISQAVQSAVQSVVSLLARAGVLQVPGAGAGAQMGGGQGAAQAMAPIAAQAGVAPQQQQAGRKKPSFLNKVEGWIQTASGFIDAFNSGAQRIGGMIGGIGSQIGGSIGGWLGKAGRVVAGGFGNIVNTVGNFLSNLF